MTSHMMDLLTLNLNSNQVAMTHDKITISYAGGPEGTPCLKLGWVFFFSMVDTNLHISLLIIPGLNLALSLTRSTALIVVSKKRPNQNSLSASISRGRGPTHPYLCDVSHGLSLKIFFFNGGHIDELRL